MLEGITIVGLTPGALLLVVVWLVVTGRLVPRRTYNDKAAEADRWHAAYELERTAHATAEAHSRELLEVAKTSEKFFQAFDEKSTRVLQTGDS